MRSICLGISEEQCRGEVLVLRCAVSKNGLRPALDSLESAGIELHLCQGEEMCTTLLWASWAFWDIGMSTKLYQILLSTCLYYSSDISVDITLHIDLMVCADMIYKTSTILAKSPWIKQTGIN